MTERQDLGPEQELKLTDDEFDTEGNARKRMRATDLPQPGDEEEDTEGNVRKRARATDLPQPGDEEEDTEGNRRSWRG